MSGDGQAIRGTLRLLGHQVHATGVLVEDEHRRRQGIGAGAFSNAETLRAAYWLPTDERLPLDDIPTYDRRLLRSAPKGLVEFSKREIVRRAVAPIADILIALDLTGAATGSRAEAAVRRVSTFSPFCRRQIVVSSAMIREESHMAPAIELARRWGIGIRTQDGFDLVPTEPFVLKRHSYQRWWLAERVYEALGDSQHQKGGRVPRASSSRRRVGAV